MRPLIVDLGKDFRGGQHQALLLLQGLRARHHVPEFIAIRDSQMARRAKDAGISVHEVSPGSRRLAAAWNIRRLVLGNHVDVVHANEPHALSAAWLARAHRSVPVIAARRIALPLSTGSFAQARYRAAARIVAVSRFVERSVIASGLPAQKVEVIYDGVAIPSEATPAIRDGARGHFAISPDTFCIGNVAAFVPEKGHALLLHAFAELRKRFRPEPRKQSREMVPACVLLLRGEGPEQAALRKLARELEIQNDVRFLPPTADIETIFAAMDLFAFPSHAEPLGSALLAAMAHGIPCVALARGGVPEIIEDTENGLLVHNLDPAAFAAGLARLQTDPEYALRIGKAARAAVAASFSADRMVEATLQLYEKVTGDQ
ncbi:MAG: glycosyltransferase family 4 protein [Acidobacteriia bacterium]|nr:glycosyltransferase family 4 protein [Terriglobia bacterium]